MSQQMTAPLTSPPASPTGWQFFSLDNRYIAPIFITCILLVGHLSFGILESYQRTLLAIVVSIVTELALGRLFFHKWVHPASAYISGISVGILVRSPAYWPYALCAAISIMSKYVLRIKGRHIWNPSNFGISVLLLLAPETVAGLSIQWGNYLLAHAGDLGVGLGDYLAAASLPYHFYLCRVIHCFRFYAQLVAGKSVAIRDCTHHRTHVPAFYFLHDHRSEDHCAIEEVAVCSGIPGRSR